MRRSLTARPQAACHTLRDSNTFGLVVPNRLSGAPPTSTAASFQQLGDTVLIIPLRLPQLGGLLIASR
jgi:hypothetical protein